MQLLHGDGRADGHPHLPARAHDLDRAVLRGPGEDPERVRRLGEAVHLCLQRHDLVARVAERRGEPVVLSGQLAHLGPEPGDLLGVGPAPAAAQPVGLSL